MVLQSGNLESLSDKAKKLEKRYEWLQATKIYQQASDFFLDKKNILKAAEFQENVGFCFYKAALQAKSNDEFRKIIECSILAYERELNLLKETNDKKYQVKIKHANALAAYARSWYETDPNTIKKLLNKWWTLENQVIEVYEQAGDLHSLGKIGNDLLEYSTFDRYWLASNFLEQKEMYEVSLILGEKTIKIFSKGYS